MSTAKEIVLDVRDLTKQFPMGKDRTLLAVDRVSFTIRRGECFAVIGESGCGKSTLARLITRVEDITSGEVFFLGEDLAKIRRNDLKAVRRNMQIIFQSPISVISPRMKIGTFLMEPYLNYRLCPKDEARGRIRQLLSDVRLSEDLLEKYPHQLSGGELQRICIARAFSLHPELLVCDEITSALDVSVQEDVLKSFHALQAETGTACLFICHDLAVVNNYSDTVMVMYLGQAVEVMKSKELGMKAVHPYTRGLLRSILFISSRREGRVQTIGGEPQSPVNIPDNCHFCTRCSLAEERCFGQRPPLREVEEGHWAACFRL